MDYPVSNHGQVATQCQSASYGGVSEAFPLTIEAFGTTTSANPLWAEVRRPQSLTRCAAATQPAPLLTPHFRRRVSCVQVRTLMAAQAAKTVTTSPQMLVFLGGRQISSSQGKYGDWRWFDKFSNDYTGANSVAGAKNLNVAGGLWDTNQPE